MARVKTGQLGVTGAAAQIAPAGPAESSVYVLKAPKTNVATLYVGDSSVTAANGWPLAPGETLTYDTQRSSGVFNFDVPISDWYGVGTAGDKVAWLAHLV